VSDTTAAPRRSPRQRRLLRGTAVGLAAGALSLAAARTPLMRSAELRTFDARTRVFADPAKARPDVVIATIDERSLRELAPTVGRWPWPREVHAAALDYLKYAGAKLVVFDVQFPEADRANPASDSTFVDALANDGIGVLPMALATGRGDESGVAAAKTGEAEVRRFALPGRSDVPLTDFGVAVTPFPALASAAAGVGSITLNADNTGGVVHRERLVWKHGGRLYPSIAFEAARLADPARFGGAVALGERELSVGRARVPLDDGEMVLRWRGPMNEGGRQTYPTVSYSRLVLSYDDVYHGRAPAVPPAQLKGKIVLVGSNAGGLGDLRATPFGVEPGVAIHAAALDNLLSGDFLRRAPGWANAGTVVVTALAAGIAATAVGSAAWGTVAAVLILLLAAAGACGAFAGGVWLDAAAPALAGGLAYAGSMAASYFTEDRERRRVRGMFSRYLDERVVKMLADEGHDLKLGGQRVPLTILFSDIRGFTSLSEKMEAEDVVAMLNDYLGAMTEIVYRHEGTHDKFIGDAVMAFWGAPVPVPDHARRAAECALEMCEELERLNARWAAEGKSAELRIGIGINTGEAVVGNIGSLRRKLDYTAIGDAVNLASRLEGLNKDMGTTIIISDATLAALGDGFDAAPLPEVHVKGKEQAVRVHELRGLRRAAALASAAAAALLLALPHPAQAQARLRWTDRVYQPGRWRGGQVVAWQTTNPATDTMAMVAQVDGFQKGNRWRAEIRKVGADQRLTEPLVLVAEANRVQVITGVAGAPLQQNAAKDDPVVQWVVSQFDANGALKNPGAGRLVTRAPDRKVVRVVVRQPSVQTNFGDDLLAMSRGRRTLTDIVHRTTGQMADNRTEGNVATAGLRGVTRIQTPSGTIDVNPDSSVVRQMDARAVDAVAVDAFVRGGKLGAQLPVKEETTP
jgi:adenylate cyclase